MKIEGLQIVLSNDPKLVRVIADGENLTDRLHIKNLRVNIDPIDRPTVHLECCIASFDTPSVEDDGNCGA